MTTDPFTEVEQQVRQLLPIVLLAPALVVTVAGLCIWLAGIRFLKLIAALTAAGAGFVCAWHFTDKQLVPLLLFAVIPLALSFFLSKPIVVLLAAALTFALIIFIPAGVNALQGLNTSAVRTPPESTLDFAQSIQKAEEYLLGTKQWLIEYAQSVPSGTKAIAYMAALGVIGIGLFSWRLVCGAACSVLGIVLLAGGMTLLLFYKGAEPLMILKQNWPLIGWILVGMCIVGTLVQYWISPKKKKEKETSKILSEGERK